ncbi:MAG: hypothetical protein RL033_1659, partial [Pseudomonadota bacterium]
AVVRATKIREVKALIDVEDDPVVRAMAKNHLDEVAGRLGILAKEGDVRGLQALHSAVQGETAPSPSPPPNGSSSSAPPERARSPSRVEAIRQQILGAALEHPELLLEPAILLLLEVVDGDLALGLATLRTLCEQGRVAGVEPATLVAEFPLSLRPQVSLRLVAPELKALDIAREVLSDNLQKLTRLQQPRERASVVEELRRAAARGDLDSQLEMLKVQQARAKARHGLS